LDAPSFLTIAVLTGCAFVAGLVDAVAGGGGLITVPALLAAGLPPHLALGTNKGQSVFGSGSALLAYLRRGALSPERAKITFPAGLVGSFIGAACVLAVPPALLKPIIVVLLPLAAVLLVVKKPTHGKKVVAAHVAARRAVLLALVVGAYDGFFGPGTGTFLIVGFVLLLDLPLLAATADAKVVNFASNLAAVALFAWRGTILWSVALPMAAGQLAGGWVGAHLAVRGGARLVRAGVIVAVVGLTLKILVDLLSA
jgi:uncharacterized membrane protein YfcA